MDIPVTAKAAILQVLLEGPAYGREILRRISEVSGGEIEILLGSLYPALAKLEAEGLVTSSPSAEQGRGPQRIEHRLTAKGRRLAERQRTAVLSLFGARP